MMNEENVVYMYNGILFTARRKVLAFMTTWMNLEDVFNFCDPYGL